MASSTVISSRRVATCGFARGVRLVLKKFADVLGGLGLRTLHSLQESVAVLLFELADDVGGVVGLHLVEDGNRPVLAHLGDEFGGHIGIHLGNDIRNLLGIEPAQNLPLGVYVETFEEYRKRVRACLQKRLRVDFVKLVGFQHHDEIVERVAVFALCLQDVVVV